MRIRTKIILAVLIPTMVVVVSGISLTYYFSSNSLKNQISNHLLSVAQNKAHWVSSYFSEKRRDAFILALSPLVKQALRAGPFDFAEGAYTPAKLGKNYFRNYKKTYGYYDLFLISPQGDIRWTVREESDLRTNLNTGPCKDTNLAKLFRSVTTTRGRVGISDYEYYASDNKPTAFIAAPVYKGDALIGVVALQIGTGQIDKIMQDRTGLGKTGEAYLVGQDYLMRSNSRFFEESTILKQKVDTENIRDCLKYEAKGLESEWHDKVKSFPDYRGVQVIGTHIWIPKVGWALLAEINEAEAFSPLRKLLLIHVVLGLFFIFFGFVVSIWISQKISKPIKDLQRATEIIGRGDLDYRTNIKIGDEIGELSRAFDKMTADLKIVTTSRDGLNTLNQRLKAGEQQLKASNQQLKAGDQQLEASNQQLRAAEQQLKASNQQLKASNQQLRAAEQQLKASNQQLKASNQQLRAAEQQTRKANYDLGERVKELNCLYGISQIAVQPDTSLEEMLQKVADRIPPSWQYPEITCARIILEDREVVSDNFNTTKWKLSADILIQRKKVGVIEVFHLEEKPEIDEGPFSKEERNLIDAIAEQLASITERNKAEETLRKYSETQAVLLREIDHRVKNNLAAIISLLHKEEDRAEAKKRPTATSYLPMLRSLAGRIQGLSVVHSLLSESGWRPLVLGQLCERVIKAALQSSVPLKKIDLTVTPSPIRVNSNQAHHLTLVINELAINALRHAFRDRNTGRINVTIKKNGKGGVLIHFRDDGPGYPQEMLQGDFSKADIGFELIRGIVAQSLDGEIQLNNDNGAITTIFFKTEMEPGNGKIT